MAALLVLAFLALALAGAPPTTASGAPTVVLGVAPDTGAS
jgi:hypothetical protein